MMMSVDRTFMIGARAVDLMKTYCLTAAPRSYELWYAFVTGLKPNLNRSVESIIQHHTKLSESDVDALHTAHLDGERWIVSAARTSGNVAQEIDLVGELIDTAVETSERYGRSLETLVQESEASPPDRTALRAMLAMLIAATREVSGANRLLAERFKRSREEIAALRRTLEEVRHEALSDPLTGIANRRLFDSMLVSGREMAVATARPLGLLLIDIDMFKRFNDDYGHATGDQVLRLVTQAMRASVEAAATLARIGGEEFAVLLPGTTLQQAHAVAERIRGTVERRELVRRSTGQSLGRVTLSIGVVALRGEEPASALLHRADRCLYAAKRAGRNRTVNELDTIADAA